MSLLNQLHEAIRQFNPQVVTIRGSAAYDINDNIVNYDKSQVQTELDKFTPEQLGE